jgi:hypothetical protein
MPNYAQKKKGYFNISKALERLGFSPGVEDWRIHTSRNTDARVHLFILQKRRWMTIYNSKGFRMITCLQPRNQKQLELLLVLSRVDIRDAKCRLVRTDNEVEFNKL